MYIFHVTGSHACSPSLYKYEQHLFMNNMYTNICVHISHACASEIVHTAYILFVLCIHLCVILWSVNIPRTKSHKSRAVQAFQTWNSSAISLSYLSFSGLSSNIWYLAFILLWISLGQSECQQETPMMATANKKNHGVAWTNSTKGYKRVVSLHVDKQLRFGDVHTRWQGHLPWKAVTCTHRSLGHIDGSRLHT